MIAIGDFEIRRIEEMVLAESGDLFAEWQPGIADAHPWLSPNFYNRAGDTWNISVHSWLVKTPEQTILIDTSGGNRKQRPASPRFGNLNTAFLERLRAAGGEPDAIALVLISHLHVDHIGWNTRLENDYWVPTFKNATYVMPRIECELRDPRRGAAHRPPETHMPFKDSIQPILDAGLARLVEGNEQIADGIDLIPIPGHAPGQMAVRLRSGGQEALFIADAMHQPIQIYHPEWNSRYCEDPILARETRKKLLDYAATHNSLILPGHFGAPHCGYVRRKGNGFAFEPADETP